MQTEDQAFKEIPSSIKDLADAFSRQSKYSNQLWVAVIAAAALVVFPNVKDDTIELPFSLGRVDKITYTPVGFLILTVLLLAYCQAYAQAHTVARFSHRVIDESNIADRRQLYDFSVIASFARVGPLVDLLYAQLGDTWLTKIFGTIYYVALKLTANIIMLGIPAIALATAYLRLLQDIPLMGGAVYTLVVGFSTLSLILAGIAIAQISIAELEWIRKVLNFYSARRFELSH